MKQFTKSFTQQEPIPEPAIQQAVEVMRSGKLHRYNTAPGEESQASLLEREYAEYQGAKYCIACSSGGYAIHIALRISGANAYTLAPVPGAIHNAGGVPVFVEIDDCWHIDIADLEHKAASSGAKFLLLSHMRGHIADMHEIVRICEKYSITMIEDCAHTMGARWKACFSTQTYKHMNSGEGGFITTNDEQLAARAIMHSGSYMLYERHGAAPDAHVFSDISLDTPNYSGRMDNLRATLLRTQLQELDHNIARWNERYRVLEAGLRQSNLLVLPVRESYEEYVGSSIQFLAAGLNTDAIPEFVSACAARGVELKLFGAEKPHAFTSRYDSWRYLGQQTALPNTLGVLAKTLDMRVPLTFDLHDCQLIAEIICEEAQCFAA